jgi:peptidase M23-like protein
MGRSGPTWNPSALRAIPTAVVPTRVIHSSRGTWRRRGPVGNLDAMLIVTCALLALLYFPDQSAPVDLPGLAAAGQGGWRWPLAPVPRVVRDYRPPPRPWLRGHRGVDLAARPGQPVFAAGAGRVGYAGRLAGRGVVTVVHGALRTSYLPVRPVVRAGQRVTAGQRLGLVEDVHDHCGRVRCLHWGLRRGLVYLDPLSLLGRGPVRLLPVWRPAAGTHSSAGAAIGARKAAGGGSFDRDRSLILTSATAAGGGAIAGALLAYGFTLAWRRMPGRRRLPPDVIDLARERRRRDPPRRGT